MPRKVRKPIGTIYQETTEKTAWDKVKEFLEVVAGGAVVLTILYFVFT